MNPEVLIVGCGFLGESAADLFSAQGRRVLGLVRTPESANDLKARGIAAALCDVTDDVSLDSLRPLALRVPLAIYAVSSGGGNAQEYAAVYRDGLRRVLKFWNPQKLIFVSSTSVYEQNDGSWVTEMSPAIPERATARVLLEAEEIALASGGTVARFTGIYGPGRSMLLRKFLSGEALLEAGGGRYLNQIHRDDGAAALACLGEASCPSGIYNVTDDAPATQKELYGWISDFLKRPMPPDGATDPYRKRAISSKRVSNSKMRSLGWQPRYPTYKVALQSLVNGY